MPESVSEERIVDMSSQNYSQNNPKYWRKQFSDIVESLVGKYDAYKIFFDFLAFTADLLSNGVDGTHAPERYKTAEKIMTGYTDAEQHKFFALIDAMQNFFTETFPAGFDDLLGTFFETGSMGNKRRGQDFTPDRVGEVMSRIIIGENGKEHINLLEPTCGSGNLILKFAEQMRPERNPSSDLCVTAVDKDIKCVYMTYIQLSYYCIPAVVIHGDTLLVEEYSRWYTPTYIANDWSVRQQCSLTDAKIPEDVAITYGRHPMLGFIREPELMKNIEKKVQNGELDELLKNQGTDY